MDTIFDGLQEQSRLNTTNAPRSFIEVDTHEAATWRLRFARPKFNKEIFPHAAVREGVDELSRAREAGT